MPLDIDQLLNDISPGRLHPPAPGLDGVGTVLVTGAGGSIGAEISRQLAMQDIERLVLLGRSELGLFELARELSEYNPVTVIASVTDHDRMENVLHQYRPQLVYHAAALKHVPLGEQNPGEFIKNNVFGTVNLLDLCHHAGVESVTVVSTDKAINPTSVMGATKRAAEMYALWQAHHGMKTVCVRFGNVLGSSGSVVPIFQKQIESGGPLTVTHPDMDRYFMAVRDAALLTINAASIADSGRILTIDMGEPVRIVDVAEAMMSQMGMSVPVAFTGVRPGEKIHEELVGWLAMVGLGNGILCYPPERFGSDQVRDMLVTLRAAVNASPDEARAALKACVPEYR